jgi:ATP-dependent exoDNAse (exonuclease V) beta subunit
MLTFNAERHEYRWNGQIVPSVTQVLDLLSDYSMVPLAILERKKQIGQALHAAIELDLNGELDYDTIHPVWEGYFIGWQKFISQSGFVVESNEQKIFSEKYRFAGTLDLVGQLNNESVLIDAKTTAILMPTVGPQTAAYAEGIKKPRIKRYALQLSPDGKYNLEPCTDKNDWAIFQAALTLWYWRQKCKKQ